jgi:hypothetical protein
MKKYRSFCLLNRRGLLCWNKESSRKILLHLEIFYAIRHAILPVRGKEFVF